ncbi:hypothetical protein [Allosphingosinicella sp.]|jgi:hypothetical protein|uniref:hypothetical protein n=1 Tax=Allosphingosinicella sp. TaxID=2823234 RepID=UPI002F14787D
MRRLVFLILGLALATPASGQIVGKRDYGDVPRLDRFGPDSSAARPRPGRDSRAIRRDIDRLRDSGAISRRDARQLSREARALGRSRPLSGASARAVDAELLALRSRVAVSASQPRRGR